MTKPGRNDPCPCGSGTKYKKCCEPKQSLKRPLAGRVTAMPASQVYREGLKNRETGNEASSDFRSGVSGRALEHGVNEDEKSGAKPTQPGTDSSVASGISSLFQRMSVGAVSSSDSPEGSGLGGRIHKASGV
jgi:hypothetical protein